jgi:hypothetical protein
MKKQSFARQFLLCLVVAVTLLSGATLAKAQGTITFNNAALFSGTNYYELGMWFHVIIPGGGNYYDGMAGSPAITGPSNVPYNSTPYIMFLQQYNPYDYVVLSLTNGYSFGLTSIQLADPNSPSLTPVSISFIGSLGDGSTVTNTFVTPGGGATTFLNYSFNSDFASGLTSVKIDAPRWAMDNLVFTVPEPGATSLLVMSLLVLAARKIQTRRRKGE